MTWNQQRLPLFLMGLLCLSLGLFNKRVRIPWLGYGYHPPAWFVGIWRIGMIAFGVLLIVVAAVVKD